MATFTQDRRLIAIDTPLGKDKLLLHSMTGEEGISRLFRFDLDLFSEDRSINYKDLVGKPATLTLRHNDGKERYIHGYISRFSQGGSDNWFAHYQAELVPWLWFLTRTANCKIFQQKTVPDVIKKVFQDFGFSDFRDATQGSYQPWDYCVQYRETAFNFVSRLMEQEGIFYYFEHEKSKHTLVMADKVSACKACPDISKFQYEVSRSARERDDVVTAWDVGHEYRPGKYSVNDYNFTTPSTGLLATTNSTVQLTNISKYEIYDYPGEYDTKSEGETVSRVRMEEEETPFIVAQGSSYAVSMISGYTFDLQEHYRKDLNKSYLLTHIQHSGTVGETYHSGIEGVGETYDNRFTCVPKTTPYRPLRVTPKPIVQGPQTAVVVGPSGEEIYTDKYGRVKVQFFWDRDGKKDENSSCWVRVSSPWAGKNWGFIQIPRIGQEVIVEFLEGDPDQPIITGRVYNAEQMPPYTLPDHMTRSTMLSRSTKGGSSKNFNELRFEDKKGDEQVFFHAEKDMDTRVKNDSREMVMHDRHLIVQHDQIEMVQNEKHLQVLKDQIESVGGDYTRDITGNQIEKITGDRSAEITGNDIVKATQDISRQSVMNIQEKSGMNWAHEATMNIHLKGGMQVVVEAGLSLTLKGPGGFVNINPAGVFIQGNMVFINSGGAAGAGSGASPKDPKNTKQPKDPDKADDQSKGTKL